MISDYLYIEGFLLAIETFSASARSIEVQSMKRVRKKDLAKIRKAYPHDVEYKVTRTGASLEFHHMRGGGGIEGDLAEGISVQTYQYRDCCLLYEASRKR